MKEEFKRKIEKTKEYKIAARVFSMFFLIGAVLFFIFCLIFSEISIFNRKYIIVDIESQYIDGYRDLDGNMNYKMEVSYIIDGIKYNGILDYDDDILKLINAKKIIAFYDKTDPNKIETDFIIIHLINIALLLYLLYIYFSKKEERLINRI